MSGLRSRNKGKRGEREAAQAVRECLGVDARRGVQYAGGPESADIEIDLPGVHCEVKRCEQLRIYDAVDQAKNDADPGSVPLVLHRRNGKEWLAIVTLDDLRTLSGRIANLPQCDDQHCGYYDIIHALRGRLEMLESRVAALEGR